MSTRFFLIAALCLISGSATTAPGEGSPTDRRTKPPTAFEKFETKLDWKLTRDEAGIRSYELKQEGSPMLSFKGEAEIDAPIDVVLSVLIDGARSREWIGFLSESVVIRWIDRPRAYVQFSRFALPWPVKDRVFVSRVVLEIDPETFAAAVLYQPTDDVVDFENAILGNASGTRYLIQPIDGGSRTNFIGIGVADPNGSIPKWLVNLVGGSVLHNTIEALREQVRKDDVFVIPLIESLYVGFEVEPRHNLISADPPRPE